MVGPIAAAIAASWYVCTAVPGLGWYDTGELQAAAAGLGVAHPTGFPALLLSGKLASWLPFGSIGFRINLVASFFGAIGAGFAAALAARACPPRPRIAATLATAVWLLSDTLHRHATAVEVYAPVTAVVLAGLWVASSDDDRAPWALAALTALGAGLHAVLVLPLGICWAFTVLRNRRWVTGAAQAALAGLVGLALWMTTVGLSSLRHPFLNWGHPSDWPRLWAHTTASTIREAFDGGAESANRLDAALLDGWAQIYGDFGVLVPVAIALVIMVWVRSRRTGAMNQRVVVLLGAVAVGDLLFTLLINPMGISQQQTLGIALGAVAVLTGVSVGAAFDWRPAAGALATISVVLAIAPGLGDWPLQPDRRADAFVDQWLDWQSRSAPPGSILALQADATAGPWLYRWGIEGSRPDMALWILPHLYDPEAVKTAALPGGEPLFESPPVDADWSQNATQIAAARSLIQKRGPAHPVLWELGEGTLDAGVADLLSPGMPLWTARGQAPTIEGDPLADPQFGRWWTVADRLPPPETARLLADLSRNQGLQRARLGNQPGALRHLSTAVRIDPTFATGWSNLGALLINQGKFDEALEANTWAIQHAPRHAASHVNLAVIHTERGQWKQAAQHARAAVRWARSERRRQRAEELLDRAETEIRAQE